MDRQLREDADAIVAASINAVLPDEAVHRALKNRVFPGRIYIVAVGKAAWQMAKAAKDCLGDSVETGIVITKYGHVKGELEGIVCREAGHPVPDDNSYAATKQALALVDGLSESDTVLFLLSGGGSALFEKPLISADELQDVTNQLLSCGADIVEINTIRKRLSEVKGGRFAKLCEPARVFSVVLSDVLGDVPDMIASGPAYPDSSTKEDAAAIAEKYNLVLSKRARELLTVETPKELSNVTTCITGSVRQLCSAAAEECRRRGYEPFILTDRLCCQAKEAGSFLASIARSHAGENRPLAFLAGGETVVKLTGTGKGGRNQELALSAAKGISGLDGAAVFSVGSDGTDGPTDAAGGYADADTCEELCDAGADIYKALENNDSYHALKSVGGLIFTGPTGTNVNDIAVVLLRGRREEYKDLKERGTDSFRTSLSSTL
ncbi:MAG: glycerate kinase [Eubacteriales bacterium]|nr:glycerate kinase [Eubacteriales bacterium]